MEISLSKEGLEVDCTCPAIENWGCCKHIVAAGLALAGAGKPRHPKGSRLSARGKKPFSETSYPNLAGWVKDGWVEIGYDRHTQSFIRVTDEGGTVWEGRARYPSLHHALADAERAIAEWVENN